jgi:hypothetical protein
MSGDDPITAANKQKMFRQNNPLYSFFTKHRDLNTQWKGENASNAFHLLVYNCILEYEKSAGGTDDKIAFENYAVGLKVKELDITRENLSIARRKSTKKTIRSLETPVHRKKNPPVWRPTPEEVKLPDPVEINIANDEIIVPTRGGGGTSTSYKSMYETSVSMRPPSIFNGNNTKVLEYAAMLYGTSNAVELNAIFSVFKTTMPVKHETPRVVEHKTKRLRLDKITANSSPDNDVRERARSDKLHPCKVQDCHLVEFYEGACVFHSGKVKKTMPRRNAGMFAKYANSYFDAQKKEEQNRKLPITRNNHEVIDLEKMD